MRKVKTTQPTAALGRIAANGGFETAFGQLKATFFGIYLGTRSFLHLTLLEFVCPE
jgi:hypothetical protein